MSLFLKEVARVKKVSNFDFYPTITSRGLKKLQGAEIIVNLIKSMLATEVDSVFYARTYGTSVRMFQYDPMDSETIQTLRERLITEIGISVPPIELISVEPTVEYDTAYGKHYINVNITFTFDKNTYAIAYNLTEDTYTAL